MRCRVSGVEYEIIENNWIISHVLFVNYGTKKHMENGIELNELGMKEKQTAIPFNYRWAWNAIEMSLVYNSIKANLNNGKCWIPNVEYQTNYNGFWSHQLNLCMRYACCANIHLYKQFIFNIFHLMILNIKLYNKYHVSMRRIKLTLKQTMQSESLFGILAIFRFCS